MINLKEYKHHVAKRSRICFALRKSSMKDYFNFNTSVTYLRFFQNTVFHRWLLFLCYQTVSNSTFQHISFPAQCLEWDALLSEIKSRAQPIWEGLRRYCESFSKASCCRQWLLSITHTIVAISVNDKNWYSFTLRNSVLLIKSKFP